MVNDRYYRRFYHVAGAVLLVALIYLVRLFYLQVIDKSTISKADGNALVRQTVYPARGLIYDRNGKLLVYNQPIYEVTVITREMAQHFDTLGFCRALDLTLDDFYNRMDEMRNSRSYSGYTPQIFLSGLSKEAVSPLSETLYNYPGVSIRRRTLRDYSYNAAAHVVGSVGEVNQNDIDRDPYFQAGDYSGRDGIERRYEERLRGQKGVEVLMRDAKGRMQGAYHDGELDKPAKAGENLTLTIDIELQLLAEELMAGKMGSVVAIEPQTGEVLALVSTPAWNPKDLVGRQRGKNYSNLLNDPHHPLMNRATQAQYPPGSTFKLLQTLVALQEGTINLNTQYPCSGPKSTPIKCTHNHGSPVSLEEAIEQSCNPYFWCVFRDLLQTDGYGKDNQDFKRMYNNWRENILSFGLGSKFTDSDIPDQVAGSIPSVAFYDRIYGKKGWKAITIRSLSIGQGEILVTPLQLANEVACIANSGYYITPHLVRDSIYNTPQAKHFSNIDANHFDVVKRGMNRVMNNGTGRWYNIPELMMCGKTGTVQNPHGKDHAIFVGFAPMDNPKIAVAVAVENAGFGATWACPVASLMMEKFLTDSLSRDALYDKLHDTHLIDE